MSLEAQRLQSQIEIPIWPYIKTEIEYIEEGTKIILSSYIRRKVKGTMYKTLSQFHFVFSKEDKIEIGMERLNVKFHDYCYKILVLEKPNIQEIDTDQRSEIERLKQLI